MQCLFHFYAAVRIQMFCCIGQTMKEPDVILD